MAERIEIRLAGTGGQGIILAGVLLADAALRDGKHVVQTQSYGPEARGGTSRAEVVISDADIHYPKVLHPNVLLCMSQEACDRYADQTAKDGLLIVDSGFVSRAPTTQAVRVPFARVAMETTGREFTANVVALGLLVGLTGVVSRETLETAVQTHVPQRTEELNLKALAAGFEAAEQMRAGAGE